MRVLALLLLLVGVAFASIAPKCPQNTYDHAEWPKELAGNTAVGECVAGYSSDFKPLRLCQNNGVYSNNPTHRCLTNYCPAEEVDGIEFGRTKNRDTALGVCPAGTSGAPTRFCDINGEWGPVVGECVADE